MKNNFIKYICLAFSAAATLLSCAKVDPTLEVDLAAEDSYVLVPTAEYVIPYDIHSGTGAFSISFEYNENINKVEQVASETDPEKGEIRFKIAGKPTKEQTILDITVTNGHNSELIQLAFEAEDIVIPGSEPEVYSVDEQGGEITVKFGSNSDVSVTVPVSSRSMLSVVEDTKAMTTKSVRIAVAPNDGFSRKGKFVVKTKTNTVSREFTVEQKGLETTLSFVSSLSVVTAPNVLGSETGRVFWKGLDESYNVMSAGNTYTHTYSDGEASHRVYVQGVSATGVSFQNLKGLSELDVTEF